MTEAKDYTKMSKEELIAEIHTLKRIVGHHRNYALKKQVQVRNFRLRLIKIRNSLDYMLVHPFSNDNSYRSAPHERDNTSKNKQLPKSKYSDYEVLKLREQLE